MIPTIAIGDIHGSTYWKEVVNESPGCRYVFLGDYLDPYEYISSKKMIDNLKEIIHLKNEQPDNVILLLGNHDMHYITADIIQSTRFDFFIAERVSMLFRSNIQLFMYAFQEDNCIFTHAGISEKWFFDDFKGEIDKNIAEQLNNPHPEQIPALYRLGAFRGGNKNAVGGIFWADICELKVPLQGFTQIVGHNRVKNIHERTHNNGGRIIFCDCLWKKHYLKI